MTDADWDARVAAVWARADDLDAAALVAAVDALAAERPPADAAALFERACARDTAGIENAAEPLYRAALAAAAPPLDAYRRARATIQLASTLRLLGRLDDSEALLRTLLPPTPGQPLQDEANAFLALTLAAQGRHREAAGIALATLAPHLSRYRRSVGGNAGELLDPA